MTTLLAALFTTPITLSGPQHAIMLAPLCLAVSVVYKAVSAKNLRRLPLDAAVLCATIIGGMYAVGIGLWALYRISVG